MSQFVYGLELEGGYYYVGMCSDPQARLQNHLGGRAAGAAAWTALHRPVRLLGQVGPYTRIQAASMEETKTLEMMNIHGVPNVRGAQWTQITLSAEDFRSACQRSITCLGCGFRGHNLATCPGVSLGPNAAAEPPRTVPAPAPNISRPQRERLHERNEGRACARCGRDSHSAVGCYARTHLNGTTLEEPPRTAPPPAPSLIRPPRERPRERDDGSACFRCGRDSHWAAGCYARTHADGTRLADPPRTAAPARTRSTHEPQSEQTYVSGQDSGCVMS